VVRPRVDRAGIIAVDTVVEWQHKLLLLDKQAVRLTSTNGVYSARWQTDGNWVVYHGSNPIWSTKTDNKGIQLGIGPTAGIGIVVKVPYTAWYNNARGGTGSYFLDMQNDGNLVEYKSGVPVWATNTVGR